MLNRASKAHRDANKKLAAGRTGKAFREDLYLAIETYEAVCASLGEPIDKSSGEQPPDETERLSRALPDLLSLERYERRALSRRRRAIRRFDALA
jgi:hypothetical protein